MSDKKQQIGALVYIRLNFNSEYPESATEEINSIIYNTIVAHDKINRVESVKSYTYLISDN